jgi:hypothetical protein
MGTDRWMRVSDLDRDSAANVLREAYATGRLGRGEHDTRAAAVCAAQTRGELCDLTADLPGPAAAALPSDLLASQLAARRATWRRHARKSAAFLLVLTAGVAGRVLPDPAWLAAVMILAALLAFSWPDARGG